MASLHSLLAVALSTLAFACASEPPATATLTAADVAKIREAQSQPKAAPVPVTTDVPEDGKLVCHAARADRGSYELYLKWTNGTAKGVLRDIAPSGNVTTTNVGADSHGGVTVVDELFNGDLAEHAAIVKNHDGKRLMRVNGTGAWLVCTYAS